MARSEAERGRLISLQPLFLFLPLHLQLRESVHIHYQEPCRCQVPVQEALQGGARGAGPRQLKDGCSGLGFDRQGLFIYVSMEKCLFRWTGEIRQKALFLPLALPLCLPVPSPHSLPLVPLAASRQPTDGTSSAQALA